MFLIIGKYRGDSEVIDQADTRREAQELAAEYEMAFGPMWRISVVRA